MPTVTGRATDYITFSRASNATVTDSSGFIEWAGHNLLTNSESFDASAWGKSGVTVTANAIAAPNGTTTSDKTVASTTGTNAHQVTHLLSLTSGIAYTARAFMKAGEYEWGIINLYDSTTGNRYVYFNLSSGVVGTTAAGCVASISSIGNGWYLCSVTGTVANTTVVVSLEFSNADNVSDFSAVIGSGIYLWGAHLYRSDLGGMVLNPARGDAYYPTTPPNLLGYTEAFDNAGWTRYELLSFGSGSVANATIAPNGLQTADLITENTTATASHFIYQDVVFSGTGTLSVYAKSATGNRFLYLRFLVTANNWATSIFDLATGSVTQQSNGSSWSGAYDATITTAGNGWYRCSLKVTASSVANITFGLSNSGTPSLGALYGDALYTGDGTSGIYLWGAQLSDSASLDTYSPVYGAAVTSAAYYAPRLDFDPVTLAAKGLLVEEQRTNLLQRSAEFDNAYWGKNKLNTTGIPAWVNVGVAPDGTLSAEKLIPNTTSAADHNITSTNVSSGNYTMSIYAKADGYSRLMLYDNGTSTGYGFDLSAGTMFAVSGISSASSPLIVPVGNGWYRCSIYAVGALRFDIYVLNSTSFSNFAGNGTDGVLVWGAQVEAGSFPTSYIPTGAASATRSADVASVATSQFPYSATEGSIVVNWGVGQTSTTNARLIWMDDTDTGTYENFITLRQGGNVSTAGAEGAVISGSSTQAAIIATTPSLTVGSYYKAAFAYSANDFAFCFNGGSVGTDTSGTVPSGIDLMRIGSHRDGTYLNGHIRQITYIPRRLTNAELQARTA